MIAANFPARRMQARRPQINIDGKLGYCALSSETAMSGGAWPAAQASAAGAQRAQRLVAGGERAVFALCGQPGHLSTADMVCGYCFLNHADIAAEMFRVADAARVAVLDVDSPPPETTRGTFHIIAAICFSPLSMARRRTLSLFARLCGRAWRRGRGGLDGQLSDAAGHLYAIWAGALDVSLGVDACKDDPIGFFRLESRDFTDCGQRIAGARLPTLFAMEGGYAVAEIEVNAVNVPEEFANG